MRTVRSASRALVRLGWSGVAVVDSRIRLPRHLQQLSRGRIEPQNSIDKDGPL